LVDQPKCKINMATGVHFCPKSVGFSPSKKHDVSMPRSFQDQRFWVFSLGLHLLIRNCRQTNPSHLQSMCAHLIFRGFFLICRSLLSYETCLLKVKQHKQKWILAVELSSSAGEAPLLFRAMIALLATWPFLCYFISPRWPIVSAACLNSLPPPPRNETADLFDLLICTLILSLLCGFFYSHFFSGTTP